MSFALVPMRILLRTPLNSRRSVPYGMLAVRIREAVDAGCGPEEVYPSARFRLRCSRGRPPVPGSVLVHLSLAAGPSGLCTHGR